jgi:hypothetical protein
MTVAVFIDRFRFDGCDPRVCLIAFMSAVNQISDLLGSDLMAIAPYGMVLT